MSGRKAARGVGQECPTSCQAGKPDLHATAKPGLQATGKPGLYATGTADLRRTERRNCERGGGARGGVYCPGRLEGARRRISNGAGEKNGIGGLDGGTGQSR